MNLCNFITLLQSNFWHWLINKNNLLQTITTYTKRVINESQDTNAQPIAHTDSKRTAILIYIWGEIFLAYNARIWGGGFRLAIMRVCICGKIFALHNTHIKHGENPKIIMQKPSRIHKNFRQKDVYVWAIFKASCNTSILDPNHFPL